MAIKVIFTLKCICAFLSQNVSFSVCINLLFNIFKIFSMDESYEWMIFKLMHLINKGVFIVLIVVHMTLSCNGGQETIALSCNLSSRMQWCWLVAYLWRKRVKIYILHNSKSSSTAHPPSMTLSWNIILYLLMHSLIYLHIHQDIYCLLLYASCCARHGFKCIIKH